MTAFDINILAVLVAALVTFALGALWYSPALLGKQWATAHGYTPEKIQAMRKAAGRTYGVSFICYVVMAAVLAIILHRIGVQTVLGGVKMGALCWLGFAATIGLTAHVFSERKLAVYLIDAGYQLVSLLGMGIILAVWR